MYIEDVIQQFIKLFIFCFSPTTLLYEEMTNDQKFDVFCQEVTLRMIMYSKFVSLLQLTAEQKHVNAVMIICELRRV